MIAQAGVLLWVAGLGRAAFTFSFGSITQCGSLDVSWTGGTPPFTLEYLPFFGSQRHTTIPDSAFSNGAGKFSAQVPFAEGKQFLVVMSDATGEASGGVSNVQTTGAPLAGATNCNTTDPGVAFIFETNTALKQCIPYTFTNFNGGIGAVTITGYIPGGQTFTLKPPVGSNTFDWTASVKAGTSIVFGMVDSAGRLGGSSDLTPVGSSDDASCLNNDAPASTAHPPSMTQSTSVKSSQTSSPSSQPSQVAGGNSISVGAIAGSAIGGLVALAALITLGLFFLRKRRGGNGSQYPHDRKSWRRSHKLSSVDLSQDNAHRSHPQRTSYASNVYPVSSSQNQNSAAPLTHPAEFMTEGQYEPDPFTMQTPPHSGNFADSPDTPGRGWPSDPNQASMLSAGRRKAAAAGVSAYKPSRFILHTDVDEAPEVNEEEVVELPPQYTDRRQPSPPPPPHPEPPSPSYLPYLDSDDTFSGPSLPTSPTSRRPAHRLGS